MAIYSLIPLAPLPGSAFLKALLPPGNGTERIETFLARFGPYIIIGAFLTFRLAEWPLVDQFFTPIVKFVTFFALDI
jgi:Zn-dependent protease